MGEGEPLTESQWRKRELEREIASVRNQMVEVVEHMTALRAKYVDLANTYAALNARWESDTKGQH